MKKVKDFEQKRNLVISGDYDEDIKYSKSCFNKGFTNFFENTLLDAFSHDLVKEINDWINR